MDSDKQRICPKCQKDYGDIYGLWYSCLFRWIDKTKYICKMCGHEWYVGDD